MRRIAGVLLAIAVVLAGCSGGNEPAADSTAPAGDVTVSTPPDSPSPSPSPTDSSDGFDTALEFTKLVHTFDADSLRETRDLIRPESAAARYVAHQTLMAKAYKIAGLPMEPQQPTIKGDASTGQIKITYEPVEGERATSYTWKDFTFDQGKLTGWTGASGPVGKALWTRETSDESRGRKAVLKSAYLSNNKTLNITVELSSDVATSFSNAEYAAKDGYRQALTDQHASDLDAGEKTLAYFEFEDSKFGGRLHIPYYDEDGTSQGDWELHVTIK